VQSHIWLTASSYMGKYLRISSYIRKPFLIFDIATAPLWISLYLRKILFSLLSVYYGLYLPNFPPKQTSGHQGYYMCVHRSFLALRRLFRVSSGQCCQRPTVRRQNSKKVPAIIDKRLDSAGSRINIYIYFKKEQQFLIFMNFLTNKNALCHKLFQLWNCVWILCLI
jgi:hypothetical protein